MSDFLKEEIARLMRGCKKIGNRTYLLPELKMEVKLQKGGRINTFIKNYVIDRNQLHSIKKLKA